MKRIADFSETPTRGYFIHLEDAPVAVAIAADDGGVIFHEGAGDDRLDHGYIPGGAVESLAVEPNGHGVLVYLRFNQDEKLEPYLLGETDLVDQANRWVEAVNAIYLNGRPTEADPPSDPE